MIQLAPSLLGATAERFSRLDRRLLALPPAIGLSRRLVTIGDGASPLRVVLPFPLAAALPGRAADWMRWFAVAEVFTFFV